MNRAAHFIRWQVKKTARCGLVLLSWVSGYLALDRWRGQTPRIRVLTYHRFRPCNRDAFSVDVERFEQQMRWLADRGLAVSLPDVEAFLNGSKPLQDGAVLVTIDDGYQEVWSRALPILRRYRIPAVVFVPTCDVLDSTVPSQTPPMSGDDDARLSRAELLALPESSVDVGSHSWEHRSLGRLDRDQVGRQLTRSKRDLEALMGRPITAFAYPFGTWKDFNATTTRSLAEAGYRIGFTSQHGAISADTDPYTLPRIKVEGGEPLWVFKLLACGGLDSWGFVDRSLWWLQQSEAKS